MSLRKLVITVLLVALVAGCRAAPQGVRVEVAPLRMQGGWASEVRFANTTNQTVVLVIRNPVYVMTVHGPDGAEVFRREEPLARDEQLENIMPGAHKAYVVTWTGKNQQGEPVAPGSYRVRFDFNAFSQGQKVGVPEQNVEIK